ncbi:phosphoribosylanthranilate isomerase [Haliscomenobacter hydrossis]|uniref:N-(5'-phosphoribosyl)anthranilate isomerase n=1 Tax=Haliscomenobacter hydrossis (strain ATCC 27775 / DSM 1100 / LMG 10767 / O) TaxID=760192 RepID=F4L187_HALH1|nr:phosphoribosylanthranilate isomerase [Haliscomenobacter hydrossis]AEE52819.1 Phosphoribosylanthranilate isomerase [Haliscomenobacter hydrossis DSM 1100]
MRVKVCGMRDMENIVALSQVPIDFIGFIFYPLSPRFAAANKKLEKWLAKESPQALKSIARVGVFVNSELEDVLNKVHDYELDYIQLHGSERAEYCMELFSLWSFSSIRRAAIIKAFSVDANFDFETVKAYEPYCKYFLFDTKGASFGGNGEQFDWSLLEKYQGEVPFFLSGGIAEESAEAIKRLKHPMLAGVDINSKFETAPGLKDIASIQRFIQVLNQ